MNHDDEALLSMLGELLHDRTPSRLSGRQAVRTVAAVGGVVRQAMRSTGRRSSGRRVLRASVVAPLVVAVLIAGVAVGAALPHRLRTAAGAVGLPVASSTLNEARDVVRALDDALDHRGKDAPALALDEIRALDDHMLVLIARLDPDERAEIVRIVYDVHRRAAEILGEARSGSTERSQPASDQQPPRADNTEVDPAAPDGPETSNGSTDDPSLEQAPPPEGPDAEQVPESSSQPSQPSPGAPPPTAP